MIDAEQEPCLGPPVATASQDRIAADPVGAVLADPGDDWEFGLVRDSKGRMLPVASNAISILGHDARWDGVLAWDAFHSRLATVKPPPWADDAKPAEASSQWLDSDVVRTQDWLARCYSLVLGRETVRDAVSVVAERRVIHPVRDWLAGLRWDGELRLGSWLHRYMGAEPVTYHEEVGRMFLVSAVARVTRPGCKVDTMPIFEGPQGAGKSTALRVLFGDEWFSDTVLDLESKDRFGSLRGKWCLEMAELDSMRRAEATRIKSFLSSATDSYRPPYGRTEVDVPRQCVFAGTTNADVYLRDETGSRRFWPVACGRIDLPGLERDREQLWAEAREALAGGARWHPEGELVVACREAAEDRAERDSWADKVEPWIARQPPDAPITVSDVLADCIGLPTERHDQVAQNRVARILRCAGLRRRQFRKTGSRVWAYVRVPSVTGNQNEVVTPNLPMVS